MSAGQSPGRSNTACASTSSSSSVRLANSSVFVNSRPNSRRRNRLPYPFRRRHSQRARRPVARRVSIAGEDTLFPLVCSSKQTAQKNETHPILLFPLFLLSFYGKLSVRVSVQITLP